MGHKSGTSAMDSIVAGSLAGAIADLVFHPLDTLRCRRMCGGGHAQQRGGSGFPLGATLPFTPSTPSVQLRSLYRGFSVVASTTLLSHGMYYGTYQELKKSQIMPIWLAGLSANTLGQVVWTPLEVLKQRAMMAGITGPTSDSSPASVLREVLRVDGVRGLYRGFIPGAICWGVMASTLFPVFETSRECIQARTIGHHTELWPSQISSACCSSIQGHQQSASGDIVPSLHAWSQFACDIMAGCLAGAVGAVASNPFDVIRTRLQAQARHSAGSAQMGTARANSVLHELRSGWHSEGVRFFGRGMIARVCWCAPSCALSLALFELFLRNPVG